MILAPWQRAAVMGVSPWTPAALAPSYWYDPADEYTTLDVDPAISAWTKRLGSGTQAFAMAAPNQPTRDATLVGGKRVLSFVGASQQRMITPGTVTVGTAFVVAKNNGAEWGDHRGLLGGVSGDGAMWSYFTAKVNTTKLWACDGTLTPATGLHYLDGVQTDEGGPGSWHVYEYTDSAPLSTLDLRVGIDRTFVSQCWNGWIADILIWPTALSAPNRSLVRAYLGAKWGIAVS